MSEAGLGREEVRLRCLEMAQVNLGRIKPGLFRRRLEGGQLKVVGETEALLLTAEELERWVLRGD